MLFNCLMVYASSICHFGTVLMLTLGQLAHPHFCIRHHGSDRDIFSTLALHWFVFSSLLRNGNLVGGLNPSEKYEFVSWDDDIPNIWEKNMFQTTKNMIPSSETKQYPAVHQQFATFQHRPTNSFRHSVGSPNSLVDCWDDDAILFQRLVICATFEIIQCLARIPGSQDLDSAGFSFTSCLMVPRTKGRMSSTSPPQKKGHFSRDHMRWWWWWFTNGIRSEKYCFFLGRQRSPEGPCKPCLERPLANTIPWTDEISRDLQGIGFL